MHKSNKTKFPVVSRTQIVSRLRNLHSFEFIGYISQEASDVHVIRLGFIHVHSNSNFRERIISDFYVTECTGFMRAVSKDGVYSFAKLQ
jgi:hypothetical protein